jgi:hypothetical protein
MRFLPIFATKIQKTELSAGISQIACLKIPANFYKTTLDKL